MRDECVHNGWEQTLPEIANGTWELSIFYYYYLSSSLHHIHMRCYVFLFRHHLRTTDLVLVERPTASNCCDLIKTHVEYSENSVMQKMCGWCASANAPTTAYVLKTISFEFSIVH